MTFTCDSLTQRGKPCKNKVKVKGAKCHRHREPVAMGDEETCCICLSSMDSSKKKTLKCHHAFHQDCIGKWLRTNMSCPYCREPVRDRATKQWVRQMEEDDEHSEWTPPEQVEPLPPRVRLRRLARLHATRQRREEATHPLSDAIYRLYDRVREILQ